MDMALKNRFEKHMFNWETHFKRHLESVSLRLERQFAALNREFFTQYTKKDQSTQRNRRMELLLY